MVPIHTWSETPAEIDRLLLMRQPFDTEAEIGEVISGVERPSILSWQKHSKCPETWMKQENMVDMTEHDKSNKECLENQKQASALTNVLGYLDYGRVRRRLSAASVMPSAPNEGRR